MGRSLPMPLPKVSMSGLTPGVLDRPHLAGTAHAGLHFIDNRQRAAAVARLAQALQELGGGRHVAAFALHGLDDHGGHVIGGGARVFSR